MRNITFCVSSLVKRQMFGQMYHQSFEQLFLHYTWVDYCFSCTIPG